MTPAARINAAIELIDRVFQGELADRALANWGRKNRYAGSKDRAAIADIVYGVLRRKRSLMALGGGDDGRSVLLGYVRDSDQDPDTIFGGSTYGPTSLTQEERSRGRAPAVDSNESADFPDWIWPDVKESLGHQTHEIASIMRSRAPVFLRVNLAKLSREQAISALAEEGIVTQTHGLSDAALEVLEGPRKIRNAQVYLNGNVELQDVASQAVADMVPLNNGDSFLDFCAGGGGKTLAVAGRVKGTFFAHDADENRMKDLPARASRANVDVTLLSSSDVTEQAPFDCVLVDAPCSGSGSWRRDPQGKWLLTREKLEQVIELQRDILKSSAGLVDESGYLVYATCSLLKSENSQQIASFLSDNDDFALVGEKSFTPIDGGDGFFCAVLQRVF